MPIYPHYSMLDGRPLVELALIFRPPCCAVANSAALDNKSVKMEVLVSILWTVLLFTVQHPLPTAQLDVALTRIACLSRNIR